MLIHQVEPVPISAYAQAVEHVCAALETRPEVLAGYTFGSVGAPGVSDIDLVLVCQERPTRQLYRLVHRATFASAYGSLWVHTPLVMSPEVFRNLPWLHTCQGLVHRWGEAIPQRAIAPEVVRGLDIANYHDFTFALYLEWAILGKPKSERDERSSLRRELLLLNSLKHSLVLGASICGSLPPGECAEIDDLRRRAAIGMRLEQEELAELVSRTSLRLSEVNWDVAETAIVEGYLECAVRGRISLKEKSFEFCVHPRTQVAQRDTIKLPATYLEQFRTYGRASGSLGRMHATRFGSSTGPECGRWRLAPLLLRRIGLAETLYRWQGGSGFQPLVPLGTGYEVPVRWSTRVRAVTKNMATRVRAACGSGIIRGRNPCQGLHSSVPEK